MMKMNGRTEIQMEGKNVIFPIAEYEKIIFFIIVDRVNLSIFNFVDQVEIFDNLKKFNLINCRSPDYGAIFPIF